MPSKREAQHRRAAGTCCVPGEARLHLVLDALSGKPNHGTSPRTKTKCSSSAFSASTTRRSSSRKSAPRGTIGVRASRVHQRVERARRRAPSRRGASPAGSRRTVCTTSAPARQAASSSGSSSGGCWRSPSIVTTASPRAKRSPADSAAWWPKRAREVDRAHVGVAARSAAIRAAVRVAAAVVDEEQLVAHAGAVERRAHAARELGDALLLVEHRHHHGERGALRARAGHGATLSDASLEPLRRACR